MNLPESKLLDTTFRNERSYSGHSFDVLKSGLQKYIRRSNFEKALYCASQLHMFKMVKSGQRLYTNFIHRLMVIYLEDIGICGIKYWSEINENINILLKNKTKVGIFKEEIDAIYNTIKLMCSCYKYRIGSHLANFGSMSDLVINLLKPDIPEITDIIKTIPFDNKLELYMNECIKNKNLLLFHITSILRQKGEESLIFKVLKNTKEIEENIKTISMNWYKELKIKEQFLTYLIPLAYLYFPINNNFKDKDKDKDIDIEKLILSNFAFDDYVFDKHTKNSINNTTEYFAVNGAYVYPEHIESNEYLKWLYMKCRNVNDIVKPNYPFKKTFLNTSFDTDVSKDTNVLKDTSVSKDIIVQSQSQSQSQSLRLKIKSEVERESLMGEFMFRIQLTTSDNKTDVYLIKDNEKYYIVKGPYLNDHICKRYLELQDIKKEL
jgi:hypothetical protein